MFYLSKSHIYVTYKSEEKKTSRYRKSVKQKLFAKGDLYNKETLVFDKLNDENSGSKKTVSSAQYLRNQLILFILHVKLLLLHLLFNLKKIKTNFVYMNRHLRTTFNSKSLLYLEVDFFHFYK